MNKSALLIGVSAYLTLPLLINPCNKSVVEVSIDEPLVDYRCLSRVELPELGGNLSLGTVTNSLNAATTVSGYYLNMTPNTHILAQEIQFANYIQSFISGEIRKV